MSSTIKATTATPRLHQISHDHLGGLLRGAVRAALESETKGAVGAMGCRASAALNALLAAHPVDRVGRCGSCRRPGALLGRRRRRCLIYLTVRYWLRQPDEVLRSRLTSDLSLDAASSVPSTVLADPGSTQPSPPPGRSLLITAGVCRRQES